MLPASSTSAASFNMASGALETASGAGDFEFDGTSFFQTVDTTEGRTQIANTSIFRLTSGGSAIGGSIADFFGTNSAFPTVTNGVYEIVWTVYFLKSTAGTVTWTITNTQAYTNLNAEYVGSVVGGIAAVGTAATAGIVNQTTAASALPVTGSLTTAVNHKFVIRAIVECATAGNIRLRVTCSAGTVTPLRGCFYTVRRLYAGNVGTFVA